MLVRYCLSVWERSLFFVKQKTAYEMRISDWSSDVCSSDLQGDAEGGLLPDPWRQDQSPGKRRYSRCFDLLSARSAPERQGQPPEQLQGISGRYRRCAWRQ